MTGARVSGLWIHPVKSGAAVPVDALTFDAVGPLLDRRWMIVDEGGAFLSQRRVPGMVLMQPQVGEETLHLHHPEAGTLEVPLQAGDGPRMEVEVWGDHVTAERVSPAADAWVSRVVGIRAALVRFDERTSTRPVDPSYAPGRQVAFTDGYPVLLLSDGALHQLNERLERPVGPDRFRPNIMVDGVVPHAEDSWRRIRIGSLGFGVVKACARCTIPGVDPATGEQGKEPLPTLAGYRRYEGKVWFGQNLTHDGPGGILLGDPVEILETGVPRPA